MNKTLVKSAGIIAFVAVPLFVLAQSVINQGSETTAVSSTNSITNSTTTCPLNISYMKFGANNKREDVVKLQSFLKSYEKAEVDVNGIFDAKTDAAVRAFQKKYINEIMAPWGATRASGIVRITTAKKINQIVCSIPLSLDASDLSAIAEYKKNLGTYSAPVEPTNVAGPTVTAVPTRPVAPTAPVYPTASSMPTARPSIEPLPVDLSPETLDGANDNATDTLDVESATTTRTSAAGRFWNFLSNLF